MGYYFISIGGSGARVLESLTHLCVAGLLPNIEGLGQFYTMSIDPDTGNGNVTRTETLLNHLNNFQSVDVRNGFETGTPLLKTPLKLANPFCWSPAPATQRLDDVIGFPIFQNLAVGKLYTALYTNRERTTTLGKGFRGRPSIGAAVMAKNATNITNTTAWNNLVTAVNNDVNVHGSAQIFLAGSIFGGTGAAGLPTIAGLLRNQFAPACAAGKVRIGGALLLPYFSFSPTDNDIQANGLFAYSEHFLTNTKAALHYYANNSGGGYDSLYFVGDESMTPRTFSVGAATQRNDAHIVDLFAAMAALHFYHERNFRNNGGAKLYYIAHSDHSTIQWNDLPNIQMDDGNTVVTQKLFVQFTRFIFAYLHIVKPVYAGLETKRINRNDHPWYTDNLKDVTSNSNEVRSFESYAESFASWLYQFEEPSGGRSVKLIDRNFFSVNNGNATINPKFFDSLDYGISNLTITKVRDSLTFGFWDKMRGRHRNQSFGRFLRRLYDACAV